VAGMEGLGRVFNVITNASGVNFSMKQCSAVSVVCQASGASSVAITASTAYSGGTTDNFTTANGFGQAPHWYQNTSDTGTAAWTKQTSVWTTNSLALAGTTGYTSVFAIFGSQLADTFDYLNITGTNCGVIILFHDLTVERTPANLTIVGA
jgi:hypothetical protein